MTGPNAQPAELKRMQNQNGSPRKQVRKKAEKRAADVPPVSMKHAGNSKRIERN